MIKRIEKRESKVWELSSKLLEESTDYFEDLENKIREEYNAEIQESAD